MATASSLSNLATWTGDLPLVLRDVSWAEYTNLLDQWPERRLRMDYDRGTLEIMATTLEHEDYTHAIGRLFEALTMELGVEIRGGSRLTYRREAERCGLEPDACYWIANEPQMRGRRHSDPEVDPPADLAIGVEVSRTVIARLPIYATLGFPEVWRYDGEKLTVLLQADRTYAASPASPCLSAAPIDLLPRWNARAPVVGENAMVREFTAWVRAGMPRDQVP